jgi:hypothetical protein
VPRLDSRISLALRLFLFTFRPVSVRFRIFFAVIVLFCSFGPAIEFFEMFLPLIFTAAYPLPPSATKRANSATTIAGEGRLRKA